MELSSFDIWVIYYCFCNGDIDTYEIHTNKLTAEKRLVKLQAEKKVFEKYWITKTIAYK
jgi:hypothetical protein